MRIKCKKPYEPLDALAAFIEGKNKQAEGVVVQAEIVEVDANLIAARVWGKPTAKNIKVLFFKQQTEVFYGLIVQKRVNRMAKFACRCGHIMNLSTGWSDYELALIKESRIEDMGDIVAEKKNMTNADFYDIIDEKKKTVYICPKCKRLYLEDDGDDGTFTGYVIEPPGTET